MGEAASKLYNRSVVFSDETQIELMDDCPRYVRVVDGQLLRHAHYNLTRKRLVSVTMWACFHYGDTGRAVLVEGTMNSAKYRDEIINRSVVLN